MIKENYFQKEEGSTAVEFALISLVFLTVVLGIMEAGRLFWTQNAIQYAVEEASRVALVAEDFNADEIETAASESLEDMMISATGLTVDAVTITENDIDYVEIDATYQYTAIVNAFLPESLSSIELQASARRPLVWEND